MALPRNPDYWHRRLLRQRRYRERLRLRNVTAQQQALGDGSVEAAESIGIGRVAPDVTDPLTYAAEHADVA